MAKANRIKFVVHLTVNCNAKPSELYSNVLKYSISFACLQKKIFQGDEPERKYYFDSILARWCHLILLKDDPALRLGFVLR